MAKTHGMSKGQTYKIWAGIRKRCNYKKDKDFDYYGGRGIRVCERWEKFENFFKDMGERPKGMTLDRIDNNGNYCKENCRWISRKRQMNNTRYNHLLTYKGKTMSMMDWSEYLEIPYSRIRTRINTFGWSIEKTFEVEKIKKAHLIITCGNESMSIKEWSKKTGLCVNTIHTRLRKQDWTIEQVLFSPKLKGREKPPTIKNI